MASSASTRALDNVPARIVLANIAKGEPLDGLLSHGLTQWQIAEALQLCVSAGYLKRAGREFIATSDGRTALAQYRIREPLKPLDERRLDQETQDAPYKLERRAIEEIRKRVSP